MKTQNLLKILALGAITISLGACNKKKAKVVEISELLTLDPADSSKWELEGQYVKVEHLALQGKYGNTFVGGASVGEYITDLRGVEIRVKKAPTFQRSGYGADINAEGTVVNVNGRLTLQEAKITVNSERGEDGKAAEGAGLPVYCCPAAATSRTTWDAYFSAKSYSGTLLNGVFQLASVPEQKAADSAAFSFYVAFPSEDLDTSDPDNYSLIKVNVPSFSEMSNEALQSFNAFFAEKQVGDFIDLTGLLQYDSVENAGMGMIVENFWNQTGYVEVAAKDKPVIYKTWAEVDAKVGGYYDGGFLDLAGANEEDPLSAPFSFVIDESYLNNPKGRWNTDYVAQIIQIPDERLVFCGSFVIVANFKPSKFEAYIDAVEAKLKAAGYEVDESLYNEGGIILFLLKDGSTVVKELVMSINNESQVEFQYIAPKAALDYATFAEFKAGLEGLASAKLTSLSGAAATHTSAIVDFPSGHAPKVYTLTRMYEAYGDADYATKGAFIRYDVDFGYDSVEKAKAALSAYKDALVAAGFAYCKDTDKGLSNLYKESSGELVSLFIDYEWNDEKSQYVDLPNIKGYVIVVDATYKSKGYLVPLPANDSALLAVLTELYSELHEEKAEFGAETGLPSSFNLGENAVEIHDYFYSTDYLDYGLFLAQLVLTYNVDVTEEMVTTFAAGLTGFVSATFADSVAGLWNATTGEFVTFETDGSNFAITIYKFASDSPYLDYIS